MSDERPLHCAPACVTAIVQDVLSELGPPSRVFNKPRPKMSIHSIQGAGGGSPGVRASSSRHSGNRSGGGDGAASSGDGAGTLGLQRAPRHDYFLNYFSLGVDVLMDGTTHTVSKIVLHSNFPGCVFASSVHTSNTTTAEHALSHSASCASTHALDPSPRRRHPEFNQYAKCNFAITWPKQVADAADGSSHTGAGAGAGAGSGGGTDAPELAAFDVNMKVRPL